MTIEQAHKIENHIKKMKSKKYIENLKKYPEISLRLLQKYS
jgi:putative endonuclease